LDESGQRPIIGSFHLIRKEAGRQFLHSPVILYAFAADALAAARFITAVAVAQVLLHAAVPLLHLVSSV
jgi:hypothetical protein